MSLGLMNRKFPDESASVSTSGEYRIGQQVELSIGRETDLGWVVSVNGRDEGLLYATEVFRPIRFGEVCIGYIKKVREDGKLDVSLQQSGVKDRDSIAETILQALEEAGGFLRVNDYSEADEIYSHFGVSKKKFKMALGGLLKQNRVKFDKDGIRLV